MCPGLLDSWQTMQTQSLARWHHTPQCELRAETWLVNNVLWLYTLSVWCNSRFHFAVHFTADLKFLAACTTRSCSHLSREAHCGLLPRRELLFGSGGTVVC
eukprot:scpid32383/ scgid28259/ 